LYLLIQEKEKRDSTNNLSKYAPYQKQQEFHAGSHDYKERLLRAGNQNGKTFAGGMEMAYHLTGLYPGWWKGRRFDKPIIAWAGSDTGETTRDNPQRALLGIVGEEAFGTGSIPKRLIGEAKNARGIADLLDYCKVKHVSGGWSTVRFKYYEQGRRKWQGPPVHVVWFDEEPDEDIYSEGYARTIATNGIVYTTFTPLLGMSEVVRRFLKSDTEDRLDVNMTIEDAEHIPEEERARIIAAFPAHEREARTKGIPILGSGRIFPVAEEDIAVEAFRIPNHWVHIGGLDFGWDHPSAGVRLAWDKDADIIYVTDCYKQRTVTPAMFAFAIKGWGKGLEWAWPHDGLQHDKGSGLQLKEQYEDAGLQMLPEKATHEAGGNGVEAGLMEMLERMQTGRFKVFSHLTDWFEEFRLYHRKDGKVVKEYDDIMAATRYGVMMKRFADYVNISSDADDYDYANEDRSDVGGY
jgi:phage terminase large subunit-like protein